MPILSVRNLEKNFNIHILNGKKIVGLNNVSFEVEDGEFLAVVGESGSGKSSLLKCIYRTYYPDSGQIRYNSKDGLIDIASCSEMQILSLRQNEIGYASQFLHEIPRISAVNIVARPIINKGRSPDVAREKARDILRNLSIPESLFDAYPATFSGGERQRVNIGRSVASKPRLLLLDEPTSALDPETRSSTINFLDRHIGENTTVIAALHNTDIIREVSERVVVLKNSNIDKIVQSEKYHREMVS